MRRVLIPVIVLVCLASLIGLYFHGKGGSEKDKEAPIAASSRLVPRNGMTPILELPVEYAKSIGVETVSLPARDGQREFRLPPSAIIREEDRTWVYLKLSETQYSRLEVEPLTNSEQDSWRMVESLPHLTNMTVVNVGAQLLLSEELKSQIQVGEGGG